MFRVIKFAILIGILAVPSTSAVAVDRAYNSSFICQGCGNPNTAEGLQNYAKRAHNIAYGKYRAKMVVGYSGVSQNASSWGWSNLKITNSQGTTLRISFLPSFAQGLKVFLNSPNTLLTFRVEYPNSQIKTVQIVLKKGQVYAISGGSSASARSGATGASAARGRVSIASGNRFAYLASYSNSHRYIGGGGTPDYSGWENVSSGYPLTKTPGKNGQRKGRRKTD